MTGERPSFFLLACLFENIQKRLILFATVWTQIQMFPDQRHEILSVLCIYFSFDILIDLCEDVVTRTSLLLRVLEDLQEAPDSLIGNFLVMTETFLDLLNDGSNVHNLCFDGWRVANLTYARKVSGLRKVKYLPSRVVCAAAGGHRVVVCTGRCDSFSACAPRLPWAYPGRRAGSAPGADGPSTPLR